MARARRVRKADTWKTKKWVDILAPKMFEEMKIGETFSSDPSSLIGRTIETTLRDITGDFSKQHIKLKFQITDVKAKNAYTKFVRHSLSREYMRSQIRRKTTRVEGISDIVTKDGYKLRVKSIALAVGRAQTAQEKLLRKIMNGIVKKCGSGSTMDTFVRESVLGKVPSMMYKAANKIYPVRRVEIRKIRVLEEPRVERKVSQKAGSEEKAIPKTKPTKEKTEPTKPEKEGIKKSSKTKEVKKAKSKPEKET